MTEFDCPGDGTCSHKGTCNKTDGSCICNEGYEGDMCQGRGWSIKFVSG